jgi:hypothetical protein
MVRKEFIDLLLTKQATLSYNFGIVNPLTQFAIFLYYQNDVVYNVVWGDLKKRIHFQYILNEIGSGDKRSVIFKKEILNYYPNIDFTEEMEVKKEYLKNLLSISEEQKKKLKEEENSELEEKNNLEVEKFLNEESYKSLQKLFDKQIFFRTNFIS